LKLHRGPAMDDDKTIEMKGRIYLTSEDNLRTLITDLGIALDTSGLSKAKLIKGIEDWYTDELKGTDKGTMAATAITSFLDDMDDKKAKPVKKIAGSEPIETKVRLHRDFKVNGSIDTKAGISYNSVIRQVEGGLNKGYTEADIVDGVIKAIPASSGLRNYLEGRTDLELANLRGLLRAHYNERSATERYSELGAAKQLASESATEFLMRTLDLRNKILFASKESTDELKYEPELVKGLFVRTVCTGLQELAVRQEFCPLLEIDDITDEALIHGLNQIVSRENERKKKFGQQEASLKSVNV